jgi:transglutaminase-like putative cysteine protease
MLLTTLTLSALFSIQGAKLDASRPQRSFRFVYTAAVPTVPGGAKQVRLWIPVPLDTPDQTITNLEFKAKNSGGAQAGYSATAAKPAELKDGDMGMVKWSFHDIGGGFGRSVCVESPGKPVEVELAFDVTRYETKGGGKASPEELAELKQPDKMIPLDGKVAAIAAGMKLPSDPKAAVRSLYDHTLERMKYDKPDGDKGWGRGDAEWACDARFGNCTDFHSYFMGLARVKGLPARFEMGFSIPGGAEKESKVGGYHCWAYVWLDGQGWMPVDISEADKRADKADYFFGTLDADRVTMTGGRDLTLTPAPAAGTLNFFIYPHAEVDGQRVEATKSFKRINP